MSADVERIAEVLGAHTLGAFDGSNIMCSCDQEWRPAHHHTNHLTAALIRSGVGHVPTALHQAADALDAEAMGRRDRELTPGSTLQDMREDRLIRLGILEAANAIKDRAGSSHDTTT